MSYVANKVLYPMRAIVGGTAVADQSITVSTAAIGPTAYVASPDVNGANLVTFDVQTSDVRVRWDNTDPTSTTGHVLPASTAYTWDITMFNNAKFIRDSTMSVDAVIWASSLMLS